jgi:hypothetical protein
MQQRERSMLALVFAFSLGACAAPARAPSELRARPGTASPPAAAVSASASASPNAAPAPPIRASERRCSTAPVEVALDLPALERGAPDPSQKNLRAWVDLLAHPRLAGRGSGSPEQRQVALVLAASLAEAGFSGLLADNDFCQSFTERGVRDQNVVARLAPRSQSAATKTVILGAHYDGQGRCGSGGAICPSADDNASGVAALLEVARILGARPARLQREVVIAFFGAEERGIVGSRHFVAHPPLALERVSMMVNLDMVGRPFFDGNTALRLLLGASTDTLGYVVGDRDRDASLAALERASEKTGTKVVGISEVWLRRSGFSSDSVPFGRFVPTLFLSTSIHADYHAPSDTAAKVNVGQIERAIRIVLALLDAG